jgi:hypothetical protein
MPVRRIPCTIRAQAVARACGDAVDMSMKRRPGPGRQPASAGFPVIGVEEADRDGVCVGRVHGDIDTIANDGDAHCVRRSRTDPPGRERLCHDGFVAGHCQTLSPPPARLFTRSRHEIAPNLHVRGFSFAQASGCLSSMARETALSAVIWTAPSRSDYHGEYASPERFVLRSRTGDRIETPRGSGFQRQEVSGCTCRTIENGPPRSTQCGWLRGT